jgi:HlyD family secretion protein
MKKRAGSFSTFITFVIIGAILAGAYWHFYQDEGELVITIETAIVERGDIKRGVATSGSVRALVTVEVGSQLSGQIAELTVDYNSAVAAGQLIARIDPKTFESRVQQSEADIKVARANVQVKQAGITRAKANLRRAELDYNRQKPLLQKGTISETSLDAVRAEYESAKAEVQMAKAELDNARAAAEQRQAALDSAAIDLERTYIRSPIDGVVIERSVDVGQTVAASLSSPVLFKIAQDLREIQIEANVDEADIGNVKKGNAISFTVDAYPDEEFTGSVDQIRLSPIELQNVVTYTVIITAKNRDMKLLPGMTANVEIVTGKRQNVLRVANEALRFRPRVAGETGAGNNNSVAFAGGQHGAGMESMRAELEKLGVSDEQMQGIQTEMQQGMAALREQMQTGNGDHSTFGEQMMANRDRILQRVLTAAQFDQFKQTTSARIKIRQGELWIQNNAGEKERRSVRLGLSDDYNTEIIDGDIEAGMEVITRVREKNPDG